MSKFGEFAERQLTKALANEGLTNAEVRVYLVLIAPDVQFRITWNNIFKVFFKSCAELGISHPVSSAKLTKENKFIIKRVLCEVARNIAENAHKALTRDNQ